MKILGNTKDLIVVRLDDGRILSVTNQGVALKYAEGNGHKTKKFGYDDMILMNETICKIMADVIEERDILKQTPLIINILGGDTDALFGCVDNGRCGPECACNKDEDIVIEIPEELLDKE